MNHHFFKALCFCLILFLKSSLYASPSHRLSIASMFYNEAPYLHEWIAYHRMIGIEHFWLYNNCSTDNWQEVLQPYIDEGVVEVIPWLTEFNPACFKHIQMAAFKDSVARGTGNTVWLALIDIDEFLLPMKDLSLQECLEKYFAEAAAIYVTWRNFGTGGVYIAKGEPILPYLTRCSLRSHPENGIGKSIVRPEWVQIEEMYYPHHFPLKAGGGYVNGDRQPLFFNQTNLQVDGEHHDSIIRINHYKLRDENFYQNVRLANKYLLKEEKDKLIEHYESFSKTEDFTIIDLIQQITD